MSKTLKIKIGEQEFVTTQYWWEGDDFVIVTDEGEGYRFTKAYLASVNFSGLDYTDNGDVVITVDTRYKSK